MMNAKLPPLFTLAFCSLSQVAATSASQTSPKDQAILELLYSKADKERLYQATVWADLDAPLTALVERALALVSPPGGGLSLVLTNGASKEIPKNFRKPLTLGEWVDKVGVNPKTLASYSAKEKQSLDFFKKKVASSVVALAEDETILLCPMNAYMGGADCFPEGFPFYKRMPASADCPEYYHNVLWQPPKEGESLLVGVVKARQAEGAEGTDTVPLIDWSSTITGWGLTYQPRARVEAHLEPFEEGGLGTQARFNTVDEPLSTLADLSYNGPSAAGSKFPKEVVVLFLIGGMGSAAYTQSKRNRNVRKATFRIPEGKESGAPTPPSS